jgi:hypothetical protein
VSPLHLNSQHPRIRQKSHKTWVAIGTVGDGGRRTFTVPAGIDLQNYDIVDVSAGMLGLRHPILVR